MKKGIRLLLLPTLFMLTGCFNIFHHVGLNEDGTLSVRWRFTISRALMQLSDKKNQPQSTEPGTNSGKGEPSLSEKLKTSEAELKDKWKGLVENLVVKQIDSENDTGLDISFRAARNVRIEGEEQFNLMPTYTGKKLIFLFSPEKNEKPAPPPTPGGDRDSTAGDEGKEFEAIGKAILSSARYQIFLTGFGNPIRATLINKSSGKKISLEILKVGSVYLVEFPFTNLEKNEKGHELVVELQ